MKDDSFEAREGLRVAAESMRARSPDDPLVVLWDRFVGLEKLHARLSRRLVGQMDKARRARWDRDLALEKSSRHLESLQVLREEIEAVSKWLDGAGVARDLGLPMTWTRSMSLLERARAIVDQRDALELEKDYQALRVSLLGEFAIGVLEFSSESSESVLVEKFAAACKSVGDFEEGDVFFEKLDACYAAFVHYAISSAMERPDFAVRVSRVERREQGFFARAVQRFSARAPTEVVVPNLLFLLDHADEDALKALIWGLAPHLTSEARERLRAFADEPTTSEVIRLLIEQVIGRAE